MDGELKRMNSSYIAGFFNLQSDSVLSMDKPICVNCIEHFKDNEELFIYNQYCTGFCNLLHVKIVQPQTAEAFERESFEAA